MQLRLNPPVHKSEWEKNSYCNSYGCTILWVAKGFPFTGLQSAFQPHCHGSDFLQPFTHTAVVWFSGPHVGVFIPLLLLSWPPPANPDFSWGRFSREANATGNQGRITPSFSLFLPCGVSF